MDDLEVFRSAFASSGIDIEKLMARAQQDDVKKRLIDFTTDAVNRGAFGSPTFFVGKEMFFGKDQLRDVEERLSSRPARSFPGRPEFATERNRVPADLAPDDLRIGVIGGDLFAATAAPRTRREGTPRWLAPLSEPPPVERRTTLGRRRGQILLQREFHLVPL